MVAANAPRLVLRDVQGTPVGGTAGGSAGGSVGGVDLLARISLGFPVEPWGKGEQTHFHQGGEDHKALCEAIAAGEPERAEEIARGHFTISADLIRDVLARVRAH